jgi:hypothetical protein
MNKFVPEIAAPFADFVVPSIVPIELAPAVIATVPAAVRRPCASTVNVGMAVADPYDPAVTDVFASEIVPVDVIGPPVRPVPVLTEVTVPVVGVVYTNAVPAPLTVSICPAVPNVASPVPPLATGREPTTSVVRFTRFPPVSSPAAVFFTKPAVLNGVTIGAVANVFVPPNVCPQ